MTQTIARNELSRRLDAGDSLIVVEALPESSFADAHLPGARNLPHDADDATIASVLPDRGAAIVVYCSNLSCANSTILARRLEQLGYGDVRKYAEGKQDWIEAGLPVEGTSVAA